MSTNLGTTEPAPGTLPLPPVPPTPSRPPTLLSRVRNYALAVGGLCALAGAIEGIIVGLILAPHQGGGSLILAVALDRCLLLGLGGAVFGAVVALYDWYLGSGRKRQSSSKG
jgi:hypothetical protein